MNWASRAVLDLATLAPRARKASQESLAPLALSHGTLTACHWSKSLAPLAPRAPQGRMGPLAGMASLVILVRTANLVRWGPKGSRGHQESLGRRGRRVTPVWGQGAPRDHQVPPDLQDAPPSRTG